MTHSIQDYVKKINSSISFYDCISLFLTTLVFTGLIIYLYRQNTLNSHPVTYIQNDSNLKVGESRDSRPFASINGATYTFNWCQGSKVISDKNKIIFNSEGDALASGKTLSKLCQK